jgi:hypothetical protein
MEWSNTVSLRLIDLYREKELLWNPTHANYKCKLKRLDAWNEISQLLGYDQTGVRKKVESLLTSFRRERQKAEKKTGCGADEAYKSSWLAFKSMLSLRGKYAVTPRTASFNTTLATRANLNELIGAKVLDKCGQHSERQSIGDQDIIERGSSVGWPWFVKCVHTLRTAEKSVTSHGKVIPVKCPSSAPFFPSLTLPNRQLVPSIKTVN